MSKPSREEHELNMAVVVPTPDVTEVGLRGAISLTGSESEGGTESESESSEVKPCLRLLSIF